MPCCVLLLCFFPLQERYVLYFDSGDEDIVREKGWDSVEPPQPDGSDDRITSREGEKMMKRVT